MLSAVENFGPLLGPAVALSHAHQHAHPAHSHTQTHAQTHASAHIYAHTHHPAHPVGGYVINVATEASGAPALSPTSVPTVSLSPAQLTSQLNALQALKLQQQFQQQYEQHLNNYLNSSVSQPTLASLSVALPHRATAAALNESNTPSSVNANVNTCITASNNNNKINNTSSNISSNSKHLNSISVVPVSVTAAGTNTKFLNSPQLVSNRSMMPINEFTPPPNLKHHHQPLNHIENGQSGPMNLVTNSNNAFSGTNLQLGSNLHSTVDNSRPSSSSSSVDVENDERVSPVSIPPSRKQSGYSQGSVPTAAAAVVAAYQFNYSQLYQTRAPAGLYNAPVIFSTHNPPHVSLASHPGVAHSHVPPFLGNISTHAAMTPADSSVYSAEYLKALQNAVAVGVFPTTPNSQVFQTAALTNNNTISGKTKLPLVHVDPVSVTSPMASPHSKDDRTNTTKLSTGTYLYDKVKTSPSDASERENFFKIPSGKEGSLKHRILTRPSSVDKPEANKTIVMRTHSTTSIFKKGSYIELSSGTLRRVEDMRTEDFIQCAERSTHHQLIESTVVKINTNLPNTVVIAFSYDRNRSKVDIEVAPEHPFFVYGQGWASCNPELSFKTFDLKCQRLQVGDICISLTKRDPLCNSNNKNNTSKKLYPLETERSTKSHAVGETQQLERDLQPLALTDVAYMPQLKVGAPYPVMRSPQSAVHFMPPPHLARHPTYAATVDSYQRFYQPQLLHLAGESERRNQQHIQKQLHQQHQQQQQQLQKDSVAQRELNELQEQLALSRKRRWSAPECFSNSEDDDDEQPSPPVRQKSAPTSVSSTSHLAYGITKLPNAGANCDSTTTFK